MQKILAKFLFHHDFRYITIPLVVGTAISDSLRNITCDIEIGGWEREVPVLLYFALDCSFEPICIITADSKMLLYSTFLSYFM